MMRWQPTTTTVLDEEPNGVAAGDLRRWTGASVAYGAIQEMLGAVAGLGARALLLGAVVLLIVVTLLLGLPTEDASAAVRWCRGCP